MIKYVQRKYKSRKFPLKFLIICFEHVKIVEIQITHKTSIWSSIYQMRKSLNSILEKIAFHAQKIISFEIPPWPALKITQKLKIQ